MGSGMNFPEENWLVGGVLGFHGPKSNVYPSNLRLMLNSMSEEEWLALARKMRQDSPIAWVMLPKPSENK
jgi:hypothetical protein